MINIQAKAHSEFIYYVFEAYKKQCMKYGLENLKKTIDGLNFSIRGLDKVLGANYASKSVIETYGEEALKGAKWNKFGKKLHFEHAFTVSEMKKKLIENPFTKLEAVDFIINNYAWKTRNWTMRGLKVKDLKDGKMRIDQSE